MYAIEWDANCQVERTIAIEVSNGHSTIGGGESARRRRQGGDNGRLKSPVCISEKNGNLTGDINTASQDEVGQTVS
jgi:hypothetical protein